MGPVDGHLMLPVPTYRKLEAGRLDHDGGAGFDLLSSRPLLFWTCAVKRAPRLTPTNAAEPVITAGHTDGSMNRLLVIRVEDRL
jgi:hypothetical protein